MIKQGRGAVGKVGFSAITQRRALLNITLSDGKKLPRGVAIEDSEGNYLTTSVDDGVVFLNNIKPDMVLDIKMSSNHAVFTLHSQKMHQKMCSMRQQQESANETDNNRMPAAELRHGRSGRV